MDKAVVGFTPATERGHKRNIREGETTMQTVQLGSISTGTLRTEDLMDAVIGEVEYLFGPRLINPPTQPVKNWGEMSAALRKAYTDARTVTDYDSDDAGYILDELIDALNEYAPAHVSLGMHPGDGADLGWWPTDFDGCDTVTIYPFRGERTFVDTECKLFVEINDHGNTTVKQLGGDVIWATV